MHINFYRSKFIKTNKIMNNYIKQNFNLIVKDTIKLISILAFGYGLIYLSAI